MRGYLDVEAYLRGEFIHPGGRDLTAELLRRLPLGPDDRALEIGCGTGATAALVSGETGARVVGLDRSAAMLRAAQARFRAESLQVQLVRADAGVSLPFRSAAFTAVYAESVVALLDPEVVLHECARLLQPGGILVLNERIWRTGITQARVDEVNELSRASFDMPAATARPFDRDGWLRLLREAGFVDLEATPVDDLLPPKRQEGPLNGRVLRWRRYTRRPWILLYSLQFKRSARQRPELWESLVAYFFVARKPAI